MWTRDRTGNSTPDSNTRVVRITKHNEPLVNFSFFKQQFTVRTDKQPQRVEYILEWNLDNISV